MKDRLPENLDHEGTSELVSQFNTAALSLSKEIGLDVYDLKKAYNTKPDSLTLLNDTYKSAKESRSSNILWTIVATVVFWPIAAWPGYNWFKNHEKISNVKETLTNEIARSKLLSDQKSGPQPGPFV